jgi:hypothetical protein
MIQRGFFTHVFIDAAVLGMYIISKNSAITEALVAESYENLMETSEILYSLPLSQWLSPLELK